ncbi:mechanosensitive ion channel family protein [Arenicella xantha]|uniref:Small-conductance mechanosensitive channel n=1 Tax=Arenicella xantha TaxID=644221 RepID=A0A395JJH5_9GAMM|nr:mechanosensitive ion channel domain-containing protein [Arenicella xantha]RBP49909.1 small conductance mechanosensitive channel [Arenicella xantha]
MEMIQTYLPTIQQNAMIYGLNFIKAIAIFIIGKFIVSLLAKAIGKGVARSGADPMLAKFVTNIAYALMLTFVTIAAISQLGVQTASLVAILGAAGLAIGLALQGSLANFAAGVMTIIFRPYSVGDVVEVAGQTGQVEEVDVFTTTLRLPDKTKIIIPNGQALDGPITNFTEAGDRRMNLAVGISYDANIQEAREVILKAIAKSDYVLESPAATVGVTELGDNSVNLTVRPWAKAADHPAASLELLERIKVALDEAKIGIPYPQRDVHIYNH